MTNNGAPTTRFDLDVPLNRMKRCVTKNVTYDKLPETAQDFEYIMNNIKHQAACVRYKFSQIIKWKEVMAKQSERTKEDEIFCENMKRWFLTFEPMNVFHEFKSDAGLALFQDCANDKDLALSSITHMKNNIAQHAQKTCTKLVYPIPIKKTVKPASIIDKHSKSSYVLNMSTARKAEREVRRAIMAQNARINAEGTWNGMPIPPQWVGVSYPILSASSASSAPSAPS